MKIRKAEPSEVVRANAQGVSHSNAKDAQAAARKKAQSEYGSGDTVHLSLGRAIQSELNPELLLQERAERVAELKKLVNSGQYHRSSEDVAAAVGQELLYEISSAPRFSDDE
ncbi:MAG: flagellar biosynthesis anti-sigma factor FlgM [Bdellovibrionales bacterium]|nr:flagellar biosynthesis anti-sigma factor FlgM [Bdellovibrionales bacterium]